ncbi:hypothetical protein DEO72_LG1g2278 [Vigna unguiculata]|uniref:Uncharacterized protein n=1 Tax=Vigna unguiculata TaxID=3917 RepID=A0A4D6KMA0_VIGUN|nr:hypothetical protein DEO72_LG1g2278 [Vigna unguiculata]
MNDSLVESTPTFRLCSNLNPRLGFYLLGFPKPVRFEPKHYTRTIPLRFPRFLRDSIGGTPIGRAFPAIPRRRSLIKWYSKPLVLGPP